MPQPTRSPLLVTAAIIKRNDLFLITRRPQNKPHPGLWEFPGGKIDLDESPEQALTRELREEIGVDTSIGSICHVVYHRYDWGPVLILAYYARITAGAIQHIDIDAHHWATPDEMLSLPFLPADQPIIERLKQKH